MRKRLRISFVLAATLLLTAAAVGPTLAAPLAAPPDDMIITGVIDGPITGGLPKAVEFYVVNNIADLSTYGFGAANNGGGSDGQEFTFPADSASAGDFIYVATEATEFTNFFGFAPDYTNGTAPNINGDDAIELFESGVVVDVFGDINVDGTGQPWEYMDGWAYRANGTGPDGSTFVLGNWTFSGPNALDGETDNASAATPFPAGSYVPAGVDAAPFVASTNPSNGDTGVALDADITVNFSEDVTASGTWFDITCTSSGAHTAAESGGPQSFTLNPDVDFSMGENCTVTVFAAQVADVDADDPPDNMAADFAWSFDTLAPAGPSDLLITGVVDGPLTGGLPKAVEFYVLNDITDLSAYGFGSANNGGGSDGQEFTFPADPATAGSFIYVATEAAEFTNFFGFAPTYTHGSAPNINGDDAIELFLNGSVVDIFGDINVDGTGQPWEYMDGWAYRVNGTGPDGSTFVLGNWTFSGPNALDGETDNASAATPFPIGTYLPTGVDLPPIVLSTSPANGDSGVPLNTNVDVNFSEDVTVTGSWFDITCTVSGSHTAVVSGGPQSYTLDPDADFSSGESCTLTVFAAQVADQDGTPDNMAADFNMSFDLTGVLFGACGDPATFIHAVQGNGLASPIAGSNVVVEGVVVGDYQDTVAELGGFFLQEEDGEVDADPQTSEGVFIYDDNFGVDVNPGDVVRVQGDVTEFYDLTELRNVSNVALCSSGAAVTPAAITLPFAAVTDFEYQEGMLVTFPQELTATESYSLGRYGQVSLSLGGRLFNPTHLTMPGAPAIAQQDLNDRSRIILDDHNSQQNIDPTFHPPGGLSATNTLRLGSTVTGLTGVLDYSFGNYVIEPIGPVTFTDANPRTVAPDPVGGRLKVASFNVLNYFTTIDDSGPICGPAMDQDCRGADSAFEFTRQRDKIISAITAMDADIVGLMEMENNPSAAIQDLVDGLNAAAGAGTYAFIDTGTIGTDAIKVAFIYKPASVTPVGSYAILDSSVDPSFNDDRNRPALAQTFDENATGARFTVVVNHLKSKGSPCDDIGDPDIGDGQGNCNLTRTAAATALVNWLATDPTGSGDADFLIIGDLNSYAMEDPITAIKNAGYTSLIEGFGGTGAYSYVFDGQFGYLDHALSNASLTPQVTGVTEWHINSDEPIALDYNVEYKSANHVVTLYEPFAYRASDHDPVVVGLEPTPPLCNGLEPTIIGTDGVDFLHGTNGDDVILARGGNDFIYGKGGNDTICAGDGDDRVFASFGNDYVDGGDGEDSLYGQSGNDELQGGNDDDRLFGSVGNDTLVGGDGDDLLSGSIGDDDLQGGIGNDLLFGSQGADLLAGGPGDDYLLGSQGDDYLDGGDDTDFLLGGSNLDTCFYGETNLSCEVIGP